MSTTVLGLYNVMSGGAFAQATVFALGVQPYINSSIIIQLLTIAIPALERHGPRRRRGGQEEDPVHHPLRHGGHRHPAGLGLLHADEELRHPDRASGVWAALVIIVSFIAGSSFVMWMGEQITEFGIGNGISIILFAGILSRVPSMVGSMVSGLRGRYAWPGGWPCWWCWASWP